MTYNEPAPSVHLRTQALLVLLNDLEAVLEIPTAVSGCETGRFGDGLREAVPQCYHPQAHHVPENRSCVLQPPKQALSEEATRTDVYHAVRGGQHAPAELKFVTNRGRQAAITSSAPGSFNRANGQPLRDYCISGASGLCHTRSEGTSSEDTRSEDNRFGKTSPWRKASEITSSGSSMVFFVQQSERSCVL